MPMQFWIQVFFFLQFRTKNWGHMANQGQADARVNFLRCHVSPVLQCIESMITMTSANGEKYVSVVWVTLDHPVYAHLGNKYLTRYKVFNNTVNSIWWRTVDPWKARVYYLRQFVLRESMFWLGVKR